MASRTARPSAVGPDSPPLYQYGSLLALLLASRLLGVLVSNGVESVDALVPDVLAPWLVGAVVYATAGAAILAAAYAAYRRYRRAPEDVPERETASESDPEELITLCGAAAMVLLFCAHVVRVAVDLPAFPVDVVTPVLTGAVTLGLPALVYAGARGFDLRIEAPDREALSLAGAAALAAALVGVWWIVASPTVGGTRFVSVGGAFGPRLTLAAVLRDAVVPSAFVGFGWGILYNGAIQEELREYADPAGAAAAVAALFGVASWAFREIDRFLDAGGTAGTAAAVVLPALLAAFVAERVARRLSSTFGGESSSLFGATVGVLVAVVPLLAASAVRSYPPGIVPGGASLAVVAGVAAVGYERSRSAWVPGLAFAAYLLVVDPVLAVHIARVLP